MRGINGSISQITIRLMPGCSTNEPGGDAGAKADDEHGVRVGMHQRGHVAEHPLEPHVVDFGRRFDLAADVKVPDAALGLRDRDRRVEPFTFMQEVRSLERGDLAAARDDVGRHRRDAGRRPSTARTSAATAVATRRPAGVRASAGARPHEQHDRGGKRGPDQQSAARPVCRRPE